MVPIEDILRKMETVLYGSKRPRITALRVLQGEEGNDPFKILIGTILSARSRDESTTKIVHNLFQRFKNSKELAEANLSEIKKIIRSIGFYNVKAKRIRDVSRIINEEYEGKVPEVIETLLRLPGIGRKTANCVLVYGFNKPAIPVDVHVHRISNRLGIVHAKTPEETEIELTKVIDMKNWIRINNTFVMYGQNVCLPRRPRCDLCL
ncbi:MAG TPA: endonuclease III, partial [Nitrososphaeraceae archaeon]|nr:endonuclease III [Nitrososphaeraceae archaeon]